MSTSWLHFTLMAWTRHRRPGRQGSPLPARTPNWRLFWFWLSLHSSPFPIRARQPGSRHTAPSWDFQERVWCKFSGCNLPPLAHDFFFFLFTNYPYFIYIFGKWMPFLGKNVFCRALPYQKNIFLKIISPNNRGCSVKTTVVCAELLKLLHTQCGCALSLLWVCWLDCCAADNTQPSPAKLNFSDKVTAATSNKCVN